MSLYSDFNWLAVKEWVAENTLWKWLTPQTKNIPSKFPHSFLLHSNFFNPHFFSNLIESMEFQKKKRNWQCQSSVYFTITIDWQIHSHQHISLDLPRLLEINSNCRQYRFKGEITKTENSIKNTKAPDPTSSKICPPFSKMLLTPLLICCCDGPFYVVL